MVVRLTSGCNSGSGLVAAIVVVADHFGFDTVSVTTYTNARTTKLMTMTTMKEAGRARGPSEERRSSKHSRSYKRAAWSGGAAVKQSKSKEKSEEEQQTFGANSWCGGAGIRLGGETEPVGWTGR